MNGNHDSLSIADRVATGVELLDRKRPDWDRQVDIATLNISSCTRCVLGQLHGDVSDGYDEYGINDNDAWRFGFDHRGFERGEREYNLLTAEWRRVITERRAVAQ